MDSEMVRIKHRAKTGEVYTFREPVVDDAKPLMSYINSVIREPMSGLMMDKPVTMKEEVGWLTARLSEIRGRTTVMLIVVKGGRILGNCDMRRLMGKHSHRAAIGVALRPEIRGIGIGEALMRETLELGRTRFRDVESVHLSAFAYNDRAMSLYRKLGFVEYARIPRSAKEGTSYYDEVLMSMPLHARGREST